MINQTAHFNLGIRKDIALIFSCPGQEEECNSAPVSGKTGDNLELVLRFLETNGVLSSFKSRYDFRITNASSTVHFKAKTNRTEELNSVLFEDNNLARLYNEIHGIQKYVICFGLKAEITLKKMLSNNLYNKGIYKPIYTKHLGLKSLNRIKIPENIKHRTCMRLEIIADQIMNQISLF